MVWLLVTALAMLLTGGLLDLLAGTSRTWARAAPAVLAGGACVPLAILGATALAGHRTWLALDSVLGTGLLSFGPTGLSVDRLSGLFLLISFAIATPVCVVCAAWAAHPERVPHRGLGAAPCLTLAAVTLVYTADNVFLFIAAWELLTIAFYLLTFYPQEPTTPEATTRETTTQLNASIATVVFGKTSGAALLIGALLLATATGGYTLTDLAHTPPGTLRDAAFALLIAGFAIKAGIVPLHIWMPRAYQAAPGPLRAIMAAVAVNVGFYGMWRTLQLLHTPPGWLAVTLLLLGGATALLGIAHATTHTRLTGVIAYSSVENSGLISVGYAVALIGATTGQQPIIAVGLLAATLQTVAHALGKSLLFTASAGIEDAARTSELEALRGIGHHLPTSATTLAVGALTLGGLPLTAGFVSEWFLLESLMQQFRLGRLAYALPMAIAGALVALTVGFAAVAFVRIIGLTVLGPAHPDATPPPHPQTSPWTGGALITLALGCLGVAAIAPLWVRVLAAGLDPLIPQQITNQARRSPWVLQPIYAEFSALSPTWLAVIMPTLLTAVAALALALGRGNLLHPRRVPAWRSATNGVTGHSAYTPFGFANPTRKVLATVLLTRSELTTLEHTSGGRTDDPHHDPAGTHLGYTTDVIEVVEHYLFRPLTQPALTLVHTAKTLQNGRLDAYLSYMLIALLAALTLIAALT